MAGIDKTYTDSYEDYREFKTWADKQIVTFFDGHTECIGDWVWKYEKEDFDNGERPIMNTPTWLDVYLIQNCKSKFVLDRMREVYGKRFDEYKNTESFNKIPEGYEQGRKIVIKPSNNCKFPFKRKMFNKPIGGKRYWTLQSEDNFWYNDETKKWTHRDSLYPHSTNTSHHRTTKSLVKFLRKQYLPKGIMFSLSGRYVGEDYSVFVR